MTAVPAGSARPLRLWPGLAAAALLLGFRFLLPAFWPEQAFVGVMGGFAFTALVFIWWLGFSRAPWLDRLSALAILVFAMAATWPLLDVSIATGAMGGLFPMLALPPLGVALVACAAATRTLASGRRRTAMALTIVLTCSAWTLAKTGGFDTGFNNDLMWRWSETPEDRLVAANEPIPAPATAGEAAGPVPVAVATSAASPGTTLSPDTPFLVARTTAAAAGDGPTGPADAPSAPAEWPGFRGAERNSVVRGVRIATDWAATPPVELWRRPIGPGWSSFAVHGERIYTQEQRGEDEIVACYDAATGTPVWQHRDAVRFWESNGGAGPRATPTLHAGRVYTFGATGILSALDESSGARLWSRNVATETATPVPTWGFSSSPLVVGDQVIVGASGTLASYDAATGAPRWVGPDHSLTQDGSYSSPQRLTIDGVEQIVMLSEAGATGVLPSDGRVLWEFSMSGGPILQPILTADGDLLVHYSSMSGQGIRRLAVRRGESGWTATERWASDGLKSMFNDFVVHEGFAYGFDGSIFAAVNLADGSRVWKRGRYGSGQVILLADQGALLIVSEDGAIALVAARPDAFTELAKVPALEGKTWNHPVLAGDRLFVRNGEEMAAFRVSLVR